jgi:hypothetical protein
MVNQVDDNFETFWFNTDRKLTRIIGEVINATKINDRVVSGGLQSCEQSGVTLASGMQHKLPMRMREQCVEKCLGCDLGWGVSLAAFGVDVGHIQP